MRKFMIGGVLSLAVCGVFAQEVEVTQPWARATVAGQTATGAFMTLKARSAARLVGASSPAAGVVQIHEMAMEGGVMKMRALPKGVELPAGASVELKPGGYHVMLMDLKQTLAANTEVPVTLQLTDAQGKSRTLEIKVPVRTQAPAGKASMAHMQH